MKSAGPIFSFLVFAAFFGLFTWIFEARALRILVLQHRAESFPVVEGKIVSGDVLTTYGSKGSVHYHPSLSYKYEVAGQNYTARRYRYDGHPSFSKYASADRVVQMHPPGSKIEVYYNPTDPGDALLSPRVEGNDVGILFFGFSVSLIMLYGMTTAAKEISIPGRAVAIAGGAKIISERMTTRVRLPQYNPWAWSLVTIGVISFISGFVIGVWADRPVQTAEMIVLFMALAGGAAYLLLQKRISSGSQDLVIDEAARTLQLPLTYKRKERIQCAFSDIGDVYLAKVAHRGRYGVTYTYAPTLEITGKASQRLTDLSQERAESFVAWLREKLGVTTEVGATLIQK